MAGVTNIAFMLDAEGRYWLAPRRIERTRVPGGGPGRYYCPPCGASFGRDQPCRCGHRRLVLTDATEPADGLW